MNTAIQFAHFRNVNKGRSYTVAYTIEEATNPAFIGCYQVKVGVACCAPSDQFEKRKGRLIASGRLEKNYWTGIFATNDRRQIVDTLYHEMFGE